VNLVLALEEVEDTTSFKDAFPTAKKIQHFSVIMIVWLKLFREVVTFYSENHMKPIHTLIGKMELFIIEAAGML
jgi:hypothetical protein